jgi:hypothetical protein
MRYGKSKPGWGKYTTHALGTRWLAVRVETENERESATVIFLRVAEAVYMYVVRRAYKVSRYLPPFQLFSARSSAKLLTCTATCYSFPIPLGDDTWPRVALRFNDVWL